MSDGMMDLHLAVGKVSIIHGLSLIFTGSNSLVGKLIREGSRDVKLVIEDFLKGGGFR